MEHRSRYANDPTIGPILPGFHARLAEHLKTIERLQQTHNTPELQRLMHQLKGAGKSYGYDGITTHAAAAEEALKTAPDTAAPHLQALVQYIQDIEGVTPV
jgi:HPt (histidine-containing phosphotransfer) domain-containing protein